MSRPERAHFLDWKKPVAPTVAAFLAGQAGGAGGPVDFRGQVVIVPTREAGRRLEAALLEAAEEKGVAGFFSPQILTPDACLQLLAGPAAVASRAVSLLALATVLRGMPAAELMHLLPQLPEQRNREWALALAEMLLALRTTLGDSVLFPDCAAVAKLPGHPEADRWQNLAEVERRYRCLLGGCQRSSAAGGQQPTGAGGVAQNLAGCGIGPESPVAGGAGAAGRGDCYSAGSRAGGAAGRF